VHPLAQQGAGLDYECELVAVIGKACADVPEARALDYVLGYAVGNDVSHREWQLRRGGGQWSLGKGFDGWAPFGPGIVTAQALAANGPQALGIRTRVNGEVVQDSSTADMIFSVAKTIAFLSQGTTLLPGDVIFTGT
jgi:2-keto-4-pentenoate hydratase/2-oxohepta-3-ene-1,7-dioic acid hydratase in catechol pathway